MESFSIKFFLKDTISLFFYLITYLFPAGNKIAVLAYHSVDPDQTFIDPWRMNLHPVQFENHLKFLSRYKGKFAITFDDGYKNNFTYAYPLLQKYGFKATFFVTTDFIDGKISSKDIWPVTKPFEPLSQEEIKKMSDNGMEIGSHAKTHMHFLNMDPASIEHEVGYSKKRIEQITGKEVVSFAYPISIPMNKSRQLADILKKYGYKKAYVKTMGLNDGNLKDAFSLKRIRIYKEDNLFRLQMKIRGAYNWVDFRATASRY